jgi:hypothetical protein
VPALGFPAPPLLLPLIYAVMAKDFGLNRRHLYENSRLDK